MAVCFLFEGFLVGWIFVRGFLLVGWLGFFSLLFLGGGFSVGFFSFS